MSSARHLLGSLIWSKGKNKCNCSVRTGKNNNKLQKGWVIPRNQIGLQQRWLVMQLAYFPFISNRYT